MIKIIRPLGSRGAFDRNVGAGTNGPYTESPEIDGIKIDSSSAQFVSFRINFDAISTGSVFNNRMMHIGVGSDGWGIAADNGAVNLYTIGGNSGDQSVTINTGIWYHFIGVFDQPNNTIRIYMDGNHIYTDNSYTDNSTDSTGKFRIGSSEGGIRNSDAKFGDILIGSSDITRPQAKALFEGHTPESAVGKSNIIAYFPCGNGRLDEAYGLAKDGEWVHSSDNVSVINTSLYSQASQPVSHRTQYIPIAAAGRIMSSLTNHGGLASFGGLAGQGGGLAG